MGLLIDLLHLFYIQVGVDLGGGDPLMSQQFLNLPQVGAPVQQMGGEGMTQRMGRMVVGQVGFLQVGFQQPPDAAVRETLRKS